MPNQQTSESKSRDKPLILAADNNEDNLLLIDYIAKVKNCQSVFANSGEQVLLLAKQLLPNLISIEIMLEDMSGLEVIRHLKEDPMTQNIPIVAVTSFASVEKQKMIYKAGCDAYLTKPYLFEDLEAKIDYYIHKINLDLFEAEIRDVESEPERLV